MKDGEIHEKAFKQFISYRDNRVVQTLCLNTDLFFLSNYLCNKWRLSSHVNVAKCFMVTALLGDRDALC